MFSLTSFLGFTLGLVTLGAVSMLRMDCKGCPYGNDYVIIQVQERYYIVSHRSSGVLYTVSRLRPSRGVFTPMLRPDGKPMTIEDLNK